MNTDHGKAARDAQDIVAAFVQAAQDNPDRPAIVANGVELSYATALRHVRDLAARLGPGCGVVGVEASRSMNTVIALLGVLAAGGTYCPIDPTFPIERQRTIARVSGCRVVVATRTAPAGLAARTIDLRELPASPGPVDSGPRGWLAAATADAPAYILFTSGSTGEPRAVVTPRRAISVVAHSLRELFAVRAADRVLQLASLNWDTCFEEILPAITVGAAVVIDDDAYSGSMPRLLRLIARERITVIDLPTAVWHELVHHMVEGQVALPDSLRLVVIGGEPARPKRLADWCTLDTGRVRLVNTYGCTETTLVTHAVDLHGPCASFPGSALSEVPIGRALPHVVERIDDAGQLAIGGPALAIGYLEAPVATASRFRVLDLGGGPIRYFLTGDRVQRNANGDLVHRGRLDGQIKVRGIRVDPGEVEAEIASHEGVAAVAVVGVTVADHTSLVAYVVPEPRVVPETLGPELVGSLKKRLPAHLIPSQLTVVSELVRTPSGKIDRAASHLRHAYRTGTRRSVS